MGTTEDLAKRIIEARYEDIPPETVALAKDCVLDHIANLLAGSTEPLGGIIIQYLKDEGGNPQCTVVGSGYKSSPTAAAFAHGTFARSMDFDNTWFGRGGHPVAPTLPPALALGEMHGMSGKKLLEAFVVGLEVKHRLHEVASTGKGRQSFHGRGLMGEMSGAAAGAKLLDMDLGHTQMALALAAARGGGIASTGTMQNPADTGLAARSGTEAVILAGMEYTGNPEAIESPSGFSQFFGEEPDLDLLVKDFGKPWFLTEFGIAFKKYPCQYPTHKHIDAILELRREHGFTYADVLKVEVEAGMVAGHTRDNPDVRSVYNTDPASGLDGKFSWPYTAAAAILDGEVVIDTFTDEKRFSPEMKAAMSKVNVRQGPSVSDIEEMWSKATIHLKDGRVLEKTVHRPTGIWGDPLPREVLLAKYEDCAKRVLDTADRALVVEMLEHLDELPDIRGLMGILMKRR